MAKNIASPKQTAGEGFNFESNVVAYYLVHLISGIPPFGSKLGKIEEIVMQTRALGWLLDDLLIITKSSSTSYRFAFSIKSNKQLTRNGFPKEFISTSWEQVNDKELTFDEETDFLGLITSPLAGDVKTHLDELFRWSREQKPKDLIQNLKSASKIKRDISQSLKCPLAIKKKYSITESTPACILKLLFHNEFDFVLNNSTKEKEAIHLCSNALRSNNLNEAKLLWDSLTSLAATYRVNKANVSRKKLLSDLNNAFELKEFPDYSNDYEKIKKYSKNNVEQIKSILGSDYHLDRDLEVSELDLQIKNSSFLVLLGRSGCGKSALLKQFVSQIIDKLNILWIKANLFEGKEFIDFENTFKFSYSLEELLANISNPGYIVIDGVDNILTESAFKNFILLLKLAEISDKNNKWKVILTCQSEEWNRVLEKIKSEFNLLEVKTYELLESGTEKLIDDVLKNYKNLFYLRNNNALKQLLLNLKILDIFVSKAESLKEEEVSKWVGESDVLEWFWKEVIITDEKNYLKGEVLKILATKQGDLLINDISLAEFKGVELTEIGNMEKERLCHVEYEKVSFYHDLIGDWVRTKVLIGESENMNQFLSTRITSPLWLRAIRYYGIYLLEQKSIDEWRNILDEFENQNLKLLSDSLLESMLFSKNALFILEKTHSQLLDKNGALLIRLLRRFLYVCTFANPTYQIPTDSDVSYKTIYSTLDRIPNVIYWPPILIYLHNHLNEILGMFPGLLGEIALKWLKYTPYNYWLRKDVAEMALALARKEYAYQHSKIMYYDKAGVTKLVYTAAMYAIEEFPNEVKDLALIACSRIELIDTISSEINKLNEEVDNLNPKSDTQKRYFSIPSIANFVSDEIPPAWPNGPLKSVDDDFQEACLDGYALQPVIDNNPNLAKEILLAILIKEPIARKIFPTPMDKMNLEIEYEFKWYPPMYFRGPFVYFLRKSPEIAIEAIVHLVNFATERWKDNLDLENESDVAYLINNNGNTISMFGNVQVFYWYRDFSNAPHPIVSALMALEKYFYDLIDNKQEIDSYIIKTVESSKSLAFCGLLISIGLKKPDLFLRTLKPLLQVPEFHYWEYSNSYQLQNQLMGGWALQPKAFQKMAYEWYNLHHKKWNLTSLSEYLVTNYKGYNKIFVELRKEWEKLIAELPTNSHYRLFLENIIERYNKRNYKVAIGQNSKEYWEYIEPEHLRKKNEEIRNAKKDYQLILNFPLICRSILSDKSKINEYSANELIVTIKEIAQINIYEDHITNTANALSGGIAVLFSKYPTSILDDPELEKWCIDKIINIVFNPPKDDGLENTVSIYDMSWDSFCAEVLPLIWEKNLNSNEIRKCISIIATYPNYNTVAALFSSTFKRRANLGPNWNKLQNFILLYAAIRHNMDWYGSNQSDFKYLQTELRNQFIEDKISSDFISLNAIYQYLPMEIFNKLKSINKRFGEIDLWLVKAAFNWMTIEKLDAVNNERFNLVNRWYDFFIFTFDKIKGRKPRRDDEYGIPDDWDRWVLGYVPELIVKDTNENLGKKYWEPIIGLGIPYHYYIEDFFREWFMYYFQHIELKKESEIKMNFIKEWRLMLDFAFNIESWEPNFNKKWFYIEEMATALIGLDNIFYDSWTEDLESLVIEMKDYYKKWADKYLLYSRCAVSFINFVQQPAAKSIIVESIVWIRVGFEKFIKHWDEGEIIQPLAYLLNICWIKYEQAIRKEQESFNAFKFLLSKLVEKQNPIALEIQSQILL